MTRAPLRKVRALTRAFAAMNRRRLDDAAREAVWIGPRWMRRTLALVAGCSALAVLAPEIATRDAIAIACVVAIALAMVMTVQDSQPVFETPADGAVLAHQPISFRLYRLARMTTGLSSVMRGVGLYAAIPVLALFAARGWAPAATALPAILMAGTAAALTVFLLMRTVTQAAPRGWMAMHLRVLSESGALAGPGVVIAAQVLVLRMVAADAATREWIRLSPAGWFATLAPPAFLLLAALIAATLAAARWPSAPPAFATRTASEPRRAHHPASAVATLQRLHTRHDTKTKRMLISFSPLTVLAVILIFRQWPPQDPLSWPGLNLVAWMLPGTILMWAVTFHVAGARTAWPGASWLLASAPQEPGRLIAAARRRFLLRYALPWMLAAGAIVVAGVRARPGGYALHLGILFLLMMVLLQLLDRVQPELPFAKGHDEPSSGNRAAAWLVTVPIFGLPAILGLLTLTYMSALATVCITVTLAALAFAGERRGAI